MKWFESVPNFSEGRDAAVIEAIGAAARGVPGVTLLDIERNADHHRSVFSLVGEADPLAEALFRMMRVAVERIDLRHHHGEHPRMGAVDVVPFVPLGDATAADAVALSERLAERVWRELKLPVYLYGEAARIPERSDLAYLRRGQFEGIRDSITTDPSRRPDLGELAVHPSAGIVAIGARPVLIAFNAYLTTADVEIAKRVAKSVRARDGGLAEVKALGFDIKERGRAQVSMNLTDFRKTPIPRALEAVRREAARYGAGVEESEIVGLVPEDALLDAAEYYLQLHHFERSAILERKVREAERSLPQSPGPSIGGSTVAAFVESLSARTPTPGGGSAAAVAGALGTALAAMVGAYSVPTGGPGGGDWPGALTELAAARRRFLDLADEDASAYEEVRAARKERKEAPVADPEPRRRLITATRKAASVPEETARLAAHWQKRLEELRGSTKPAVESDRLTALALLRAAEVGAAANVAINLADLRRLENVEGTSGAPPETTPSSPGSGA